MITAEIITIGTEIVLGQIADTNAPYIAKALTEKGIQVQFRTSVSDDRELLKSALKIARERVNLIITTGGLGLTASDVTREVVSEFFGVRLVHNKDACIHIQRFMEERQAHFMDEHDRQTLVPEGALVITNDNGTATGFALHHNDKEIVSLPGVHTEMKSMLNKYLEVYAFDKREEGCIVSRDLHTFGIRESVVADRVKKCILQYQILKNIANNSSHRKAGQKLPHDTRVSQGHVQSMTLVHDGVVTIELLATAGKREDAVSLLDRAETDIRMELGDAVFGVGDETLEYTVTALLRKYCKTIAIAESCTGGLVSDKLTNIPGVSEFFLEGVVAYSNKAKVDILGVPRELILEYGAVSPQVAKAMAEGVRKRASANIGIGITGIAGPTGGTKEKPVGLVYIGIVTDNHAEVKKCQFRGSRVDVKKFSANTSLNMTRLQLLHQDSILF